MKNIKEFLKECNVSGNEFIDSKDGGFWRLKDLFMHYLEVCNIPNVVNSKIIITTDESCEMIKIEKEGNELFYGNETDFNRDAETFEELFKSLGAETVIIKKPYSEW